MFIRPCYRKKNGKRHAYWALVESHRTDRGSRQRVVAYLGHLKESQRRGVKQAAEGNRRSSFQQLQLLDHDDKLKPEWVEVDTANVRVENQLDFGGPWLALKLIRKLKLDEFFESTMPRGREVVPWSRMAMVPAISRLCNPSSELHIAEHYYAKSAMPELLGIPSDKVYDERLYRALDKLLPHKDALEKHLKNRLGTLFDLEYDLLLYDVTSTYFEGNRNDVKTWREIVATMEARHGKADRIWCGDRGMMSKENIDFMESENRRYIIGASKGTLKQFKRELLEENWRTIREGLEVKMRQSPGGGKETYILCRSRDRRDKEKAMHDRFEQRIDESLKKIKASCRKRKWKKETIDRRLGKIMAKNSRAVGLFEVEVKEIDGRAVISWTKSEKWRDWATLNEGCCLLRTNVTNWSAEDLWEAYIQLTEAEAAFRIHKSDLRIRPVWHQREDRVLSHILGFVGKGLTRPIVILSVAKNLRNWAISFATLRMTGGFSDKA